MKKSLKLTLSIIMVIITLAGAVTALAISSSASAYETQYNRFDEADKNDFARWNGRDVVKGSATSKEEIKWMQAALNFCIENRGLKASYLKVDGNFGEETKQATMAFQSANGMNPDGIFAPATINMMKQVLGEN